MSFFDKLYLNLFTKSADTIVSPNGHFEFKMPKGFRFKKSRGFYQILNPDDKTFLFQWSGQVLPNDTRFEFNINDELEKELKNNVNAVIQSVGIYNCICSATIDRNSSRVYTWKIGEKNKRILVTLLLAGQLSQNELDEKVLIAKSLISGLYVKHFT